MIVAKEQGAIPPESFQPVFDRVWWHTVQFIAFDGEEPSPTVMGKQRGMGTLVYADGPCILTASHVWEQAEAKGLFAVFLERDSKPRLLARRAMTPRRWPKGEKWTEKGPDLALIGLSEVDAADLRDRDKVFLNLDTPRVDSDTPWWAVIGTLVNEPPRLTSTGMDLAVHFYPSSIAGAFESGGFDYVEVPAHFKKSERPASYGGVSGSGLWRFGMKPLKDGSIAWDETLSLDGVAFHEIYDTPEKPGVVRCHGRQSIERTRALGPEPPKDVVLIDFRKKPSP